VERYPGSEFRRLQLFSLIRAGRELKKKQKDIETYYENRVKVEYKAQGEGEKDEKREAISNVIMQAMKRMR